MRSKTYTVISLVVVSLLVAACGSNSASATLSSKPPKQILNTSLTAMKSAKSVTLSGSINNSGTTVGVDLGLTSNGEASGSIVESGQKIDVVLLRSKDYVKAPAGFWQASGHLSAVQATRIAPDWVEVPSSLASSFSSLSIRSLSESLSTDNGVLSKAGSKTVDGDATVGVRSSKGGTLWVRSSGTPYPLAITGSLNTRSIDVHFSKWNATPAPKAPKGALSATSLSAI